MASVISAELDRNVACVPLFRGTVSGERVWFVRMDVSDSTLAAQHGLNFAPRLANAQNGCRACVQTVQSTDPIPGRASVQFAGAQRCGTRRSLRPGTVPSTCRRRTPTPLDRVMAIDTVATTVSFQFIRAFSHGKDIF